MRVAPAQLRLGLVLALLVAAHFAVRPALGDPRFAPDLVLVALLFFAIRVRPMAGTIAGFLVGLVTDAVAPTAFGAAAFALTIVGYLAGWLKAIVFADNLLVNALFVFVAAWVRDAILVLVAHQLQGGSLAWQLLAISPLAAASTAAAALLVLIVFRGWIREGPV
ncbi:MAG: rod shape-determining protein MreD [Verrucomicrobiota bacterium]